MKARNYNELLKARGYKKVSEMPDHIVRNKQTGELEFNKHTYASLITYEKKHKYYKVRCYIKTDTHGKAQEMEMVISSNLKMTHNIEEFKQAHFEYDYLAQEVVKIYDCFEQLKQMKSPKHIYCFN